MTTLAALEQREQRRPSRGRRIAGTFGVGIWLVFLGQPLEYVWQHNFAAGQAVGVTTIVAFAALYLTLFIAARMTWRRDCDNGPTPRLHYVMLLGLVALFAATVPFAAQSTLVMLVYVGAAAMFTLPARAGVLAVAFLAVLTETSARSVTGWSDQEWSGSFAILFAGAAVYATKLATRRARDLAVAREEMALMAVEEERSRMTRDLHDILGHSLTVITVKAELASRLVGADEARASAEITDIERLAREALADVRATIAGRREVSLAPELINARAALLAANIDAEVPNALDEVPTENRELFGWAVREGVTNVLRHSKAQRCEIRLSRSSVEVHDDGVGPDPAGSDGHGLRGLRERVVSAGGGILTGSSPDLGGFLLVVTARDGDGAGGHA